MRTSLVLAAALCALGAAPAFSQPQGPGPEGAPPSQGGPDGRARSDRMEHRREAMARAMKAILQLRPDQEAAFATFQASMAADHGQRGRDRSSPRGGPGSDALTTPQRVDLGLERMQAHLEQARVRAAAVKTFYAALSPDQQHAFDALARMHGPMHEGHSGRMGVLGPGRRGPQDPLGARPQEGF